ncbi:GGDEF/EAL domain-containing response regulator [Ferrovibrio sp.]|uniref:GGDEF/EAL domain-containing response regulator n=1 Tax=Ferrovibrio sp. TaxID=1917215 RepID=UPI003D105B38
MSRGNVLILDDDLEIGNFLSRVARAGGFDPMATADILTFRQSYGDRVPSHIFLDLQMPGVDGIEVLRWLAEQKAHADVIIMSGFDQKVIEAARRLGIERGLKIVSTMQKPFRVEDVLSVLGAVERSGANAPIDAATIDVALQSGQFCLVYQPKIRLGKPTAANLSYGHMVGFEALLRWRHPERGLLAPDKFLDIAEKHGLMNRLTDTVLDMALLQQQEWAGSELKTTVAVNISAQNLGDASFADRLKAKCDVVGVLPESIALELTETTAMSDPITAMDILTRIRIKGFHLSIDDFGTGYSSLVQLHMLPFSELKIDRAFVRECDHSRQSRVIAKTIIDLAHNLDLTCVAEGVETEAQLAVLRELGCDMVQGYLVSKPLQADDATRWLSEASERGDTD